MKTLSVCIVVFLILLVVGDMGYKDELVERDHYTLMVCEGAWPDYKNLNVECENVETE